MLQRGDPASDWLGTGQPAAPVSTLGLYAAVALLSVAVSWAVSPWSGGLHDGLGRWAGRVALPVVVVEVDGSLAEAAATARAGGASEVVTGLPAGHALAVGLSPEPEGLVADRDGRVRWFRGAKLPLPEALDGLVRIRGDQLDPANPTQLAGRSVVLELADPALGVPALAPGVDRPVDRAELVAVGLGTLTAGKGLWTAPPAVVSGLTVLAALVGTFALRRLAPVAGGALAVGGAVLFVAACVVARRFGFDLPVEAGLSALLVPAGVRLGTGASRALAALDRVALRLGAPGSDDAPQRSGLEARAAMIRDFVPNCAVAWWAPGPDGRPVRTLLSGDGDLLPKLSLLPGATSAGPGWRIEPVLEEGHVVGAVGIGREAGISDDAARVVEAVAHAPLSIPERVRRRPTDPLLARIAGVGEAIDRSRKRAEAWEALLADSGLPIGLFELGGDLVAAGGSLRTRIDPQAANPLVDLLGQVTTLDESARVSALRRAIGSGTSRRLPGRSAEEEVVLSRIARGDRVIGLLVQLQDVAAHQRLDELKSDLVAATGNRLRNGLSSVAGYAEMLTEGDAYEQGLWLERLRARVSEMVEDLERAEQLARTRIGQEPVHPVFLEAAVADAVRDLSALEGRLDLDVPAIAAPVSARTATLVPALRVLLGALGAHGGRIRVSVAPDAGGMVLSLQDDSGGLPEGMLEQLLDPHAASPVAGALQELVATGITIASQSLPGTGTRLVLTFPAY